MVEMKKPLYVRSPNIWSKLQYLGRIRPTPISTIFQWISVNIPYPKAERLDIRAFGQSSHASHPLKCPLYALRALYRVPPLRQINMATPLRTSPRKTVRQSAKALVTRKYKQWPPEDKNLMVDWILDNSAEWVDITVSLASKIRKMCAEVPWPTPYTNEEVLSCWKSLDSKYKQVAKRKHEQSGGGVTDEERAQGANTVPGSLPFGDDLTV
jgi:hypothetical protein